jgi:acetoin utilization deacetylase AcuC-like enzyme
MPAGASDSDYELAFKDKILPSIDEFKPEAVIISAGFDAHIDDPLGQVNLSTEFYAWMTERIMEKAEHYSDKRIISVLEGGYNLDMLPLCIEKHLSTLNSYGM